MYALGIAGGLLSAGNSYSQSEKNEKYVSIENIEKKSRELENAAKTFEVSTIYTNPTSIPFDSLDAKTKNRSWSILSNQYEIQTEQYENALKDYESLKSEKVKLEEDFKNLDINNKNLQEELKECKKQSILEGKKKD